MREYLWYTLRPSTWGGFDVHGFFEADKSSVLAGQTIKRFLDNFDTEAEAREAYPDAKFGSAWTDPQVSLGHLPSEDDPVAGGMYPDDIEG